MDMKQADQHEPVEPTQERSSCQHHWVIDPPAGGSVSKGKCRSCGEERDFPNAPEGPTGSWRPVRVDNPSEADEGAAR